MIEKYINNIDAFKRLLLLIDDKKVIVDICKSVGKEEMIQTVLETNFNSDYYSTIQRKRREISKQYKINDIHIQGPLDEHDLLLLEEFKKLFSDDDNKIIDLVVKSFSEALIRNNEFVNKMLYTLIEIKKENIDKFHFRYDNNSYFDDEFKSIFIKDSTDYSLPIFHELGHLIHYLVDDGRVPDDFHSLKFSNYSSIGSKVYEFDLKYLDEAKSMFSKYYEDLFKDFKFDFNKELHKIGVSNNVIQNVLNQFKDVSQDYFLDTQRDIFSKEFVFYYIASKYPSYESISDIIDAIYEGKLNRNIGAYGHGEDYYSSPLMRFREIVADYFTILCSPDSDKYLDILREFTSDEFVDYMDNYVNSLLINNKTKKR